MEKEKIEASEVLERVLQNHKADSITFFEIKMALHERGFGILVLVFSLPLAIPVPYPPLLPTLLVIPVFTFSLQMMLGIDSPWLPNWLGRKSIKRTTLAHVIEKGAPYLKKVERLLRPRFHFASLRTMERLIGTMCFFCAVSIALPIPLGNLIPGIGILVMALGLLGRDGLAALIGMLIGGVGLFITLLVLIFGTKMLLGLFPWLIHINT